MRVMKKLFVSIMLLGSVTLTSCGGDVVTRDLGQLPETARQVVRQHFSEQHISYIKIDHELFSTSYKVILTNGDELEFDSDGTWKEVECKRTRVPHSLVPPAIGQYVQTNFPNDSIEKIKRKRRKTEVELYNGLELIFDSEGNFERMDD